MSSAVGRSIPAVMLLLILGGCTGAGSTDIQGIVEGRATSRDRATNECQSRNIRAGDQIRVLDGSGNTLGTATLSEGVYSPVGFEVCLHSFTAAGLPRADFYQIEIKGSPGPTWSYDELRRNDWQVSLSFR
jgi:hypothetical protein